MRQEAIFYLPVHPQQQARLRYFANIGKPI